MKFVVVKSSVWHWKCPPCKEAVYNEEKKEWEINLNSLEEVLAFMELQGNPLIISDLGKNRFQIEIYDSYRE